MTDRFSYRGAFKNGDKVRLNRNIMIRTYNILSPDHEDSNIPVKTIGTILESFYQKEQPIISSVTINQYTVKFGNGITCEGIPEYLLDLA